MFLHNLCYSAAHLKAKENDKIYVIDRLQNFTKRFICAAENIIRNGKIKAGNCGTNLSLINNRLVSSLKEPLHPLEKMVNGYCYCGNDISNDWNSIIDFTIGLSNVAMPARAGFNYQYIELPYTMRDKNTYCQRHIYGISNYLVNHYFQCNEPFYKNYLSCMWIKTIEEELDKYVNR